MKLRGTCSLEGKLLQTCAVLSLVCQSCPTLCDPMDCSMPGSSVHRNSPGKNTWVSCNDFLQGIFPTQGLNSGLLHCRRILYHLSYQGSTVRNPVSQSVQSLSRAWLFVTPWTPAYQASLSITKSQSPPKPMSIESVMPSNHLTLCRLLLQRPSIFLSIRVLSNESALCIRWQKYWSFSFEISSSNEHPGLISFRMDWLDLLAVQGTFKSLLQHQISKAPILWCSAFFIVQLSHPYMTTGKTIALTRRTFADKVMSLLFIMLSRLVITFLPRCVF